MVDKNNDNFTKKSKKLNRNEENIEYNVTAKIDNTCNLDNSTINM